MVNGRYQRQFTAIRDAPGLLDPALTDDSRSAPQGAREWSILGGRPRDVLSEQLDRAVAVKCLWRGRQVVNKHFELSLVVSAWLSVGVLCEVSLRLVRPPPSHKNHHTYTRTQNWVNTHAL